MKLLFMLLFFPFLKCAAQSALKIEAIQSAPARVTSKDAKTGRVFNRTANVAVTPELQPAIVLQHQSQKKLTYQLQGNIASSGLSGQRIKKIRLEKVEQKGDAVVLTYYVKIANMAGKEDNRVLGYNYSKEDSYTASNKVKTVKIELYHYNIKQQKDSTIPKLKLVAEQTFDVSTQSTK